MPGNWSNMFSGQDKNNLLVRRKGWGPQISPANERLGKADTQGFKLFLCSFRPPTIGGWTGWAWM